MRNELRRNGAARAGPVVDDDVLRPALRQFCAMKRAVMSGPPPGVNPTTMRIGLAG